MTDLARLVLLFAKGHTHARWYSRIHHDNKATGGVFYESSQFSNRSFTVHELPANGRFKIWKRTWALPGPRMQKDAPIITLR